MNYHQKQRASDPDYWHKYNLKYHPRFCKICNKQLFDEKYSQYHKGCVIDEIYDMIYSGQPLTMRYYSLAKRFEISIPEIRNDVKLDNDGIKPKPKKENKKVELSIDEIKCRYHEAKNKAEQIQILADMNLCEKWEIIKVLVENGVSPKCFGRHQSADYNKALKNGMKVPDFKISENGYKTSDDDNLLETEKSEIIESEIEKLKAHISELEKEIAEQDDLYSQLEIKYDDERKSLNEKLEESEKKIEHYKSKCFNETIDGMVDESKIKHLEEKNAEYIELIQEKNTEIKLLSKKIAAAERYILNLLVYEEI